jgi:Arc/MetJ-type ribon-helix-helix transcriptional regulator
MTQLTIALPDEAQAYIDEQLAQGHYATVEDVITSLILKENKRPSQQSLMTFPSETALLQAIYQGVPIAIQQRYDELRECLHDETLTPNEHQELLQLVDVVEQCEVDRLEKLIQLAKLRHMSLDELMQQLNLKRSPSYA